MSKPTITDHPFVGGWPSGLCAMQVKDRMTGDWHSCGQPAKAHGDCGHVHAERETSSCEAHGAKVAEPYCEHGLLRDDCGSCCEDVAEPAPEGCTCGVEWPCPLHGGPPETYADHPEVFEADPPPPVPPERIVVQRAAEEIESLRSQLSQAVGDLSDERVAFRVARGMMEHYKQQRDSLRTLAEKLVGALQAIAGTADCGIEPTAEWATCVGVARAALASAKEQGIEAERKE